MLAYEIYAIQISCEINNTAIDISLKYLINLPCLCLIVAVLTAAGITRIV
jgi:hypothetical protein